MTNTPSQPRDVQIYQIAAGTTVMRCRSWNRLRFEIEYARERGTTANSYLIQGDRTALVDPPGESFSEMFLTALERHIDLYQLNFIVLGHINPNRAATLKILLQRLPDGDGGMFEPGGPGAEGSAAGYFPPGAGSAQWG